MSPKRKVTLYFNAGMLSETQREAIRQDRSVSWIIQAAWKIAREEVRRLPGMGGLVTPTPTPELDESDDVADSASDDVSGQPVAAALVSPATSARRPVHE